VILMLALLALFTLAWCAVFSGMETGLYSLNKLRLELRALRGERTDRAIQALLADGSTFLTLFLVGNNLVNDVLTLLGETLIARIYHGERLELLTAATVVPVLLVVGEAIPKGLFHAHAETWVRRAWPLIALARRLLMPLVLMLRPVAAILARGATQGADASWFAGTRGAQALALLLAEGGGSLSRNQRTIAANVAGLATLRVRVAMVPMSKVETVAADRPVGDALARLAGSLHGQFPVLGVQGEVRGYVRFLDLLYTDRKDAHVGEFTLALPRLADSLRIEDALLRMAAARVRMGLVVSAAGKPLGIVTHKDLVEEIVGELRGF
jgi:putative hemolysin